MTETEVMKKAMVMLDTQSSTIESMKEIIAQYKHNLEQQKTIIEHLQRLRQLENGAAYIRSKN